ncbi:hypothetical protein [Yinghuangia seranimata]|uniref:hypothetical protein n=1 Tax=Yinghuangia seranimata TaxID=408067 RepID=UPI00248C94B1|nr:hypothetical protein [Yinghuangia seranimata]MDI2125600.1 hypothetical protein [Yinghuangia seranimata]
MHDRPTPVFHSHTGDTINQRGNHNIGKVEGDVTYNNGQPSATHATFEDLLTALAELRPRLPEGPQRTMLDAAEDGLRTAPTATARRPFLTALQGILTALGPVAAVTAEVLGRLG